jgi:CheY-like chemotaxis protein
LATGLSLEALAPLQELHQQLRAAQQDAEPADHLEFLSDLYLDVHAVRAAAERAELGAAFRLGFAIESLLKKMLERPKSWTPSNVQAVVTALDLLLDVCRTGANPDLAQPPVQLLVVDDDPVARRAISGTLQLAFGRPDSVEGGEAALQLAREKPFDLIFLDVQMPGMDGFAVCSRIHQTRRNHLTPVVFVTSYDDLDSRAKAAASGGCGFVPKQVLASQLTLVALSFILRGRLGMHIPTLEAPASRADSRLDPASPASAGREHPSLARALGTVN